MLSHRAVRNAALEDLGGLHQEGRIDMVQLPIQRRESYLVQLRTQSLIHKELADFVAEKVTFPPEVFTYQYSTAGGQRFPRAMAAHINRHFKPHQQIVPDEIFTASALTGVHEMLGYSLSDPGDGVLTIPPVYGRFELDFGNTVGLRMVYAEMGDTDPFQDDGCVIRVLLIVNPNNPLGRCYPPVTLKILVRFCQTNGLHFISDEVYALSVYETGEAGSRPFCSVLSIDTKGLIAADHLHVLYGMSKVFGSAGLRIGCLITRNALLRKAMLANSRFHGVSGASLAIASTILEDQCFVDRLMNTSRNRLAHNRRIATTRLADTGIHWHKGGNAGFFLYIDLSPWLSCSSSADKAGFELAEKLLEAGVGLHPGEEHYGKKGWFRLVFSVDTEILEEGLNRLTNALAEPIQQPQPFLSG